MSPVCNGLNKKFPFFCIRTFFIEYAKIFSDGGCDEFYCLWIIEFYKIKESVFFACKQKLSASRIDCFCFVTVPGRGKGDDCFFVTFSFGRRNSEDFFWS